MVLKTAADELSPLADRLTELAATRGLALVPVTPSSGRGPVVHLDAEDMTMEAFVDLAVTAGQKLVYLDAERFDPTQLTTLHELATAEEDIDVEQHRKIVALCKTADRFTNWPITLEAAFVAEGVVHLWSIDARWHQELEEAMDSLRPADDDAEHEELSQAEEDALIERLAAELLALPAFRAASTETGRRRAAKAHLSTTDGGALRQEQMQHVQWRATSHALDAATLEEHRQYAGTEQRIPELARAIAADQDYCSACTAQARKHRVRDYLMAQADGYAPPGRLVDLVLDALAAARRRGGETGSTPMLPLMPG